MIDPQLLSYFTRELSDQPMMSNLGKVSVKIRSRTLIKLRLPRAPLPIMSLSDPKHFVLGPSRSEPPDRLCLALLPTTPTFPS
jgi:hypothetical protein